MSVRPLADDVRASVADGLADGWTLPAAWYTHEAILELEQERIFARSWQYLGRADQVAKPGDFFAVRAGHIPVARRPRCSQTLCGSPSDYLAVLRSLGPRSRAPRLRKGRNQTQPMSQSVPTGAVLVHQHSQPHSTSVVCDQDIREMRSDAFDGNVLRCLT